MRWLFAILMMWPLAALADWPKVLVAQVERNPDKYLDAMAVMIAGYGKDGALDAVALHTIVALARADARAGALQRLLPADLDGDGTVALAEMQLRAGTEAAGARGRLVLAFGKADADGDGRVTSAELQAYGNGVAQKTFGEDKAAAIYAVMGFDGNGDGRVTLAEISAGISAVSVPGKTLDGAGGGPFGAPSRPRLSGHPVPTHVSYHQR